MAPTVWMKVMSYARDVMWHMSQILVSNWWRWRLFAASILIKLAQTHAAYFYTSCPAHSRLLLLLCSVLSTIIQRRHCCPHSLVCRWHWHYAHAHVNHPFFVRTRACLQQFWVYFSASMPVRHLCLHIHNNYTDLVHYFPGPALSGSCIFSRPRLGWYLKFYTELDLRGRMPHNDGEIYKRRAPW